MSTNPELTVAREDLRRTRERLDETYGALTDRITEPARRTAATLNPLRAMRAYPWPALGVAVLAGVAAAATRVDQRAARAAAATARQAGRKSVSAAKAVPSRTRGAIAMATDSLATRLLTSFMGALREDQAPHATPGITPRDAIGFVPSTTPAFGTDSET